MTAEPKYYSCDDEQWYTHDEVAAMFQSFLDKYPDRKRTGTYKGLNYEIELINETHEFNTPSLERAYFAYTIYLTPELQEFCNTHSREIYRYKRNHNYRAEGGFYNDSPNITNVYNGYLDMPYHIHSMSVVYSFVDFQTLKTEAYVYKDVITWIEIITAVYENINSAKQE